VAHNPRNEAFWFMDVFTDYYRLHKNPDVTRRNLMKYFMCSIDVLAILLVFQVSYFVNYFEKKDFFFTDKNILVLFILILPFWLLIQYLVRITGIQTKRYKVLSLLYLQSSIAIFYLLTIFYFLFRLYPVHRLFLAELPFFGFIILYFGRMLIFIVLKRFGEKGHNHVIAIIIADDSSVPYIENLLSNKSLGYRAVVIFTESPAVKAKYENISIILPEKFSGIIGDLIEVDFVDEVLYLKEIPDSANVREILSICEDLGVTFRLKSSVPKPSLSSAVRTDIADGKFLSFINIPNNTFALAIKKTTDINIALMAIVVLSPVLFVLGFLVKITSRGPVISKLSKVGWRGRQIKVFRFRTMYLNAERKIFYREPDINGAGSEYKDDPRITKIGRFLLRSGLDQLPELFNVLRGEISIIAPRHPLESESVKSFHRKYS
jgi:lipopolysaccharide/colanic/teichoic acid biosynthesis glycosyltransferase